MACHNPSYITKHFKIAQGVKPGGTLMINCQWDFDELSKHLSAAEKRYIAKNNVQLYTINAIDLAVQVGMGKRTNTILQSAFFTLAGVLPQEDAIKYMKDAAEKSYAKKGQDVVEANWKAIDAGATAFVKHEVPAEWADAADELPPPSSRAVPSSSSRSRTSWSPSTAWRATSSPSPRSPITPTASSSRAPLRTRSAASPSWCRIGRLTSASSATSARMCARTPRSARSA